MRNFLAKNNEPICIRNLHTSDYKTVSNYLYGLTPLSQSRFGPHNYDEESIRDFYENNEEATDGIISIQENTGSIVGYSILNTRLMGYEQERLEQYGLRLPAFTNAIYAPSVADEWQGYGIGYQNFKMIRDICQRRKIDRLFLWGGVQADNEMAIRFYKRNGFVELGQFEYKGKNWDMMLLI